MGLTRVQTKIKKKMRGVLRLRLRATAGTRLLRRSTSTSAAATPASLETFNSAEEHLDHLATISTMPEGWSTATTSFSFNPRELPTLDASMTLTMLSLDDPKGTAAWAAMFTKNAFPGSPVVVGREMLATKGSRVRGIIANNKISNVFPGGSEGTSSGVNNAKKVAAAALEALRGVESGSGGNSESSESSVAFLPSSTGVIGWRIPADEMIDEMPLLVSQLQTADGALPAAQGIMTTDLYPKVRGVDIQCANGQVGRLVGVAKVKKKYIFSSHFFFF